MACGNNKVSRSYLTSQPTSSRTLGEKLFGGPGKPLLQPSKAPKAAHAKVIQSKTYRSNPRTFDPNNRWSQKTTKMVTKKGEKIDKHEELLGKDGERTEENPHIHVIRDKEKGVIRMHLTEGTRTHVVHSHHIEVPISTSPQSVARHIRDLRSVLNDPNRQSSFNA